jgi:hypothetical protein
MAAMRWIISSALTLSLIAPLAAAPRKPAPAARASPKPPAVPKLMQSCDAHKFETVVDTMVDGQPHKSKVKLCGVEGQSDAEWIKTLSDAIRKLEANKYMAPATRGQIVSAINAEIARLSIIGPPAAARGQTAAQALPSPALSRDYSALPPLPPPEKSAAPVPPIPPAQQDFAVGPSVPAPVLPAPLTAVPAAPAIASRAPRLEIACATPGDMAGSGPCAAFERETVLTISADEDVPAGTMLQFVRNGRAQGDISLAGLSKSGALRTGLPRSVCSGFGAGRLELRIVRNAGGEVLRTDGPYSLRC